MKRAQKIKPIESSQTIEEIIDELVREGVAERGSGKLPPGFLTEKLPKSKGSVVEQFLKDRRKNDW
jgi:hypothetical protein